MERLGKFLIFAGTLLVLIGIFFPRIISYDDPEAGLASAVIGFVSIVIGFLVKKASSKKDPDLGLQAEMPSVDKPSRSGAFENRPAHSYETGKTLQAVLVMTKRPLHNAQGLIQQIVEEQRGSGCGIAPDFIASARVGDADDQAYVYASIRTEFQSFGGEDVITRTIVKTFQASDGNHGSYFMLFNHL